MTPQSQCASGTPTPPPTSRREAQAPSTTPVAAAMTTQESETDWTFGGGAKSLLFDVRASPAPGHVTPPSGYVAEQVPSGAFNISITDASHGAPLAGVTPVTRSPALRSAHPPQGAVQPPAMALPPQLAASKLQAVIVPQYVETISRPDRSAAMNDLAAPASLPVPAESLTLTALEGVPFVRARDLPSVRYDDALDGFVDAAERRIGATLGSQWCPPPRPHAGVATTTLAFGQVPYGLTARLFSRFVAHLAAWSLQCDVAPVAAAIAAVRAHERARRTDAAHVPARRCGLWFVEVSTTAPHVTDALLRLAGRVLLSAERVVICAGDAELDAWTQARDAVARVVMDTWPEVRRDAHSKFQKGLGALSVALSTSPGSLGVQQQQQQQHRGPQHQQRANRGERGVSPQPMHAPWPASAQAQRVFVGTAPSNWATVPNGQLPFVPVAAATAFAPMMVPQQPAQAPPAAADASFAWAAAPAAPCW